MFRPPRRELEKIALGSDAGPHFLKAGATIDGSVEPRHEGYHGLAATHSADDGGQLAAVTRRPLPPTGRSTGGTTLRLVEQALLQVEALLPGGEDELRLTITANDGLVFQRQSRRPPLPGFSRHSEVRPAGKRATPTTDASVRRRVTWPLGKALPSPRGQQTTGLLVTTGANYSRVTAGSIGRS
jgi:hypothetical protein